MNIRTFANPIPISETSGKSWNQEHFAWTFPKPSMPSRKERSRPSELQITVLRQDQRKLEEGQKPAHIWIRHSFRKIFQRPSIYLAIRIQASFRHHYNPKTRDIKTETKKSKDDKKRKFLENYSKKETGPYVANTESKKIVKYYKPKRINKGDKTPSKASVEGEIFKDSKSKSEINPESKYSKLGSKTYSKKYMKNTINSKKRHTESTCSRNNPKKDSTVILKKNCGDKSETCSINISNVDLIMYLEEFDAKSMDVDTWSENYSQNNSKKGAKKKEGKKDGKKGGKKGSDAESEESVDDKKKDKKGGKKDKKKKDSKKDTESTDAESEESKDDKKKDKKKDKKGGKKDDKKKKDSKKDTESTDAESEESKEPKKDDKKDKKASKKSDKKKDSKKDAASTEDSESEGDKKKGKKGKKDGKKKKDAGSTDADSESEGDTKKGKKGEKKGKKDTKKKKGAESTESESDVEATDDKESKKEKKASLKESKKDTKKEAESTTDDSDKSLSKQDSKKITEDSDATSTDSRKASVELKRCGFRTSSKKTTFKEKEENISTGRIPTSRERPPLPPCEPFLPSPKVKRQCQCNMPPPPPKPRYTPLPEAEWIRKLL